VWMLANRGLRMTIANETSPTTNGKAMSLHVGCRFAMRLTVSFVNERIATVVEKSPFHSLRIDLGSALNLKGKESEGFDWPTAARSVLDALSQSLSQVEWDLYFAP